MTTEILNHTSSKSSKVSTPIRRKASSLRGASLYRKWWIPYVWVFPTLLIVICFSIYPFLNTLFLSFTNSKPFGGNSSFVGFDNYVRVFSDDAFWLSLRNSLLYVVLAVPLLVFLPLIVAVLVSKPLAGIGFFRSAYYLPAIASTVVVGLAWQMMLKDDGMINSLLANLKILQEPFPFLSDGMLILICAVGLTVWKGIGYYMVLYMAALASISPSLYEAASMDGAGPIRQFWHVTIPGTRVMMYLVGVLSGIAAMRVFTEIYLLGGETGGPGGASATLPFYIRSVGLDPLTGSLGRGGAASVVLFLLTFGLIILSRRINQKAEES